jgi:hypothetical protein
VVEDAGHFCLWRCRDPAEIGKFPLGNTDTKIFRNVTNYAHLFRPAVSFFEACKQAENVLVADIGVVIQHDDFMKRERSPYFFRFWFSDHDKFWHPISMTQVSTAFTSTGPRVQLLF